MEVTLHTIAALKAAENIRTRLEGMGGAASHHQNCKEFRKLRRVAGLDSMFSVWQAGQASSVSSLSHSGSLDLEATTHTTTSLKTSKELGVLPFDNMLRGRD